MSTDIKRAMVIMLYQTQESIIAKELFKQVLEQDLVYLASELSRELKNPPPSELSIAIEKAIKVCKQSGLPLNAHFKSFYRDVDGTIYCDWKLSKMAYGLTLLNSNINQPLVAGIQIKLINDLISRQSA